MEYDVDLTPDPDPRPDRRRPQRRRGNRDLRRRPRRGCVRPADRVDHDRRRRHRPVCDMVW